MTDRDLIQLLADQLERVTSQTWPSNYTAALLNKAYDRLEVWGDDDERSDG